MKTIRVGRKRSEAFGQPVRAERHRGRCWTPLALRGSQAKVFATVLALYGVDRPEFRRARLRLGRSGLFRANGD